MKGFDPKFRDLPDYILAITREIWEDRGIETLYHYYADDIPVRSPSGTIVGNQAVIDATRATLAEFPDRQLLGEDVIWSGNEDEGFLSSHRILSTATHIGDGEFGRATGTSLVYRVIADCAARNGRIYDEWLVRDLGAIVRQLGHHPRDFARAQIEAEGDVEQAKWPLTPDNEPPPVYAGQGNDHPAGLEYAATLEAALGGELGVVERDYDRAAQLELPGRTTAHGWAGARSFWEGIATAFPRASFEVRHRIGRDDDLLGRRAAVRWSLTGVHEGDGRFGPPSGAIVHIMGISHAEYGPWGLRREYVLYDEVAIWKQIILGGATT